MVHFTLDFLEQITARNGHGLTSPREIKVYFDFSFIENFQSKIFKLGQRYVAFILKSILKYRIIILCEPSSSNNCAVQRISDGSWVGNFEVVWNSFTKCRFPLPVQHLMSIFAKVPYQMSKYILVLHKICVWLCRLLRVC